MDEFLDIFDTVSALGDLTDLTDHANTLLTALDGLDYLDFDADGLSALDDLATFGPDDFVSVADAFDPTDAFVDPDLDSDYTEWHSLDNFADPSPADFVDVDQFVVNELANYPAHLLGGLNGLPEYQPKVDLENPTCTGWWNPDGTIKLIDHIESLPLTLHHEMAHSLMAGYPDLLEEIAPHMANSPMLERLDINWADYAPEQQPREFVVETFAYFRTKPGSLQELDPALYDTFATWWQNHAGVA